MPEGGLHLWLLLGSGPQGGGLSPRGRAAASSPPPPGGSLETRGLRFERRRPEPRPSARPTPHGSGYGCGPRSDAGPLGRRDSTRVRRGGAPRGARDSGAGPSAPPAPLARSLRLVSGAAEPSPAGQALGVRSPTASGRGHLSPRPQPRVAPRTSDARRLRRPLRLRGPSSSLRLRGPSSYAEPCACVEGKPGQISALAQSLRGMARQRGRAQSRQSIVPSPSLAEKWSGGGAQR